MILKSLTPRWSPEQIGYCCNVHPGVTPDELVHSLRNYCSAVRKKRGIASMQVGLWICEPALKAYRDKKNLTRLKQCLQDEGLYVVSLNGFPQGDFHQPVVKQKVYQPTWADKSRLNYTLGLAQLLADCMPEEKTQGTISTLPLAYRLGWNDHSHHRACRHLCQFAAAMASLEKQTGKQIRLCLEMEPGCVLESTSQVVQLFQRDLPRAARAEFIDFALIERYLGVCFDICHQAVMDESIAESVRALQRANIVIGKVQVSCAMDVTKPQLSTVADFLQSFADKKYLHQVTTRNTQGELIFKDDLGEALSDENFPRCAPWRVHYHLPIQLRDCGVEGVSTTNNCIEQFFSSLSDCLSYKPHLEVETYTWGILPQFRGVGNGDGLVAGIVDELNWLQALLLRLELLSPQKLLMAEEKAQRLEGSSQ